MGYCNSILTCVLSKLFNYCMTAIGRVGLPTSFGQSYTVPIFKKLSMFIANLCPSTTFVVYRLLQLCQKFLNTVFLTDMVVIFSLVIICGFKKKSSCTHAVYTLRSVDYYVNNGSTVNICALDISKAFDKMNHHGLFLQLMQKQIPLNLLCILENWFKLCSTVLLFHESLVLTVVQDRAEYYRRICLHCILTVLLTELGTVGCYLKGLCISVLLYADDILLIAPSVSSVNKLLHVSKN